MTRVSKTGDLGIGEATDRVLALRQERDERIAAATDKIRKDYTERERRLRERVAPEWRARLDAMLAAATTCPEHGAPTEVCEPAHHEQTTAGRSGDIASADGSAEAGTTAAEPEPSSNMAHPGWAKDVARREAEAERRVPRRG